MRSLAAGPSEQGNPSGDSRIAAEDPRPRAMRFELDQGAGDCRILAVALEIREEDVLPTPALGRP